MGITITNSGQGSVVRFRNLGRGGLMTSTKLPPFQLLDYYPGAAAAYSLRKLSYTYNGSAIRVRRSSDNAEQNIGFVNNVLDTASLLTFCGAGNGFVTTWYDQSGNVNNAVQTTTGNQPQIVSSGAIITDGGKSTIYFIGSNNTGLIANSSFTTDSLSVIAIFRNTGGSASFQRVASLRTATQNDYDVYVPIVEGGSTTTSFGSYTPSAMRASVTISSVLLNIYTNFLENGASVYNGINVASLVLDSVSSIGSKTFTKLSIGASAITTDLTNNSPFTGNISEVIYYPLSKRANRSAINTNINSYYSIYTPTWQGTGTALLDLYPNAAAAYSLRNLSSTYTGPLVRVRRSSDSTEQDIYGTLAGVIDTTALTTFCGAGNGFISKWYDQSGNARDLVQVTAAIQPKIVNSGTVYTTNGKPSVYLLGGKVDFPTGFLNGTTNVSIQMVINIDNGATDNIGLLGPQTTYNSGIEILSLSNFGNRTALRLNGTLRNNNSAEAYQLWNDNAQTLTEIYANTSSTSAYKNNSAVTLTDSSATPALNFNGVYDLGQYGGALAAANNGYMQEFVIYTSNQVASRSGIATNINSYYTIY